MSVEELEKLAKLKESGALTEDEFQAKKAELLSGSSKKPEKKKSKIKTFIGVILALWIGWALIGALTKNTAALANLPECNSPAAKETLSQAFNQSQFARTLNLSAIEVNSEKQLSGSKKVRTCQANVILNNTENVAVEYKMEMREGGNYMLTFEVKE